MLKIYRGNKKDGSTISSLLSGVALLAGSGFLIYL
jgi:hypothetical protein